MIAITKNNDCKLPADKSRKQVKAIELFAGCGGLSLGFMRAGIDTVAAVEMDCGAAATYIYNLADPSCKIHFVEEDNKIKWEKFLKQQDKADKEFKKNSNYDLSFKPGAGWISHYPDIKGTGHFWLGDIQKISGKEMLDALEIEQGEIDILCGGPPCQGFTAANKHRSVDDPRSKLMWQFIRMVKEIQPRYFTIENVPGLLTYKDFFELLISSLEQCGYTVRFNEMDACSYGVPQTRKRIFIEGGREDQKKVPAFPVPKNFDPAMFKNNPLVSAAEVSIECFRKNGFKKDEIRDVWWNEKLGILMNKKTAAEEVDLAISKIITQKIYLMVGGTNNVKVG